ncbi:MAG: CBS domain-containing protein [Acholeplasmataceae bacterium]
MIKTITPIQRNQYLKDILKEFQEDFKSLPVVDIKGRFKGDITKSDIIEAIA